MSRSRWFRCGGHADHEIGSAEIGMSGDDARGAGMPPFEFGIIHVGKFLPDLPLTTRDDPEKGSGELCGTGSRFGPRMSLRLLERFRKPPEQQGRVRMHSLQMVL